MVSVTGIEPVTPAMSRQCQFISTAKNYLSVEKVVGVIGLEPMTFCVSSKHSTTELYTLW